MKKVIKGVSLLLVAVLMLASCTQYTFIPVDDPVSPVYPGGDSEDQIPTYEEDPDQDVVSIIITENLGSHKADNSTTLAGIQAPSIGYSEQLDASGKYLGTNGANYSLWFASPLEEDDAAQTVRYFFSIKKPEAGQTKYFGTVNKDISGDMGIEVFYTVTNESITVYAYPGRVAENKIMGTVVPFRDADLLEFETEFRFVKNGSSREGSVAVKANGIQILAASDTGSKVNDLALGPNFFLSPDTRDKDLNLSLANFADVMPEVYLGAIYVSSEKIVSDINVSDGKSEAIDIDEYLSSSSDTSDPATNNDVTGPTLGFRDQIESSGLFVGDESEARTFWYADKALGESDSEQQIEYALTFIKPTDSSKEYKFGVDHANNTSGMGIVRVLYTVTNEGIEIGFETVTANQTVAGDSQYISFGNASSLVVDTQFNHTKTANTVRVSADGMEEISCSNNCGTGGAFFYVHPFKYDDAGYLESIMPVVYFSNIYSKTIANS